MKPVLPLIFILLLSCNAKADTVDNYQIYIKKVLVVNDGGFGSIKKGTILYRIKKKNYVDTFDIYFNHCIMGAHRRRIELRSKQNKITRTWEFPDMEEERIMRIPIKQIKDQLVSGNDMVLYYFDEQLPEGRFLMTLQTDNPAGMSKSRKKGHP
jgi:hypothetical protein